MNPAVKVGLFACAVALLAAGAAQGQGLHPDDEDRARFPYNPDPATRGLFTDPPVLALGTPEPKIRAALDAAVKGGADFAVAVPVRIENAPDGASPFVHCYVSNGAATIFEGRASVTLVNGGFKSEVIVPLKEVVPTTIFGSWSWQCGLSMSDSPGASYDALRKKDWRKDRPLTVMPVEKCLSILAANAGGKKSAAEFPLVCGESPVTGIVGGTQILDRSFTPVP